MHDLNRTTTTAPATTRQEGATQTPTNWTRLDDIAKTLAQTYGLRVSTPNLVANRPPHQHLVSGWLPAIGVSLTFGESQARKTFLNVDLAAHIAANRDIWRHNRMILNGLVVWVGAEDYEGTERRFEAFRQHFGVSDLNILYIEQDILLTDADAIDTLAETVQTAANAASLPLRAIFIDTFEACFAGHDVNSQKDVGSAFRNLHRLARETQSHVRIIDHCGLNATDRPKGQQTKTGMSDCIDRVESDGENVWVYPVKSRNGRMPEPFGFAFQEINYKASDGSSQQTLVCGRAISGPPPKSKATGRENRPAAGTVESKNATVKREAFESFKNSGYSFTDKELLKLSKDFVEEGSRYCYEIRKYIRDHNDTIKVDGEYMHKDYHLQVA